ncbi:MAG: hypothetical protein HYU37_00655 [Acidobacteria bacterium]|nr:hypothetical protein [Acidobacteriota bacterium]
MPVALLLLLAAALLTQPPAAAAPAAQAAGNPAEKLLDFEYFRTQIQPIFLATRDGNSRCYSCHSKGTPMRLQELSPGATAWTEDQSRRNYQVVLPRVIPRNLNFSRLLLHPLAAEAGGSFYHSGGKHWTSILNPEWQTLANWVCGRKAGEKLVVLTGACGE